MDTDEIEPAVPRDRPFLRWAVRKALRWAMAGTVLVWVSACQETTVVVLPVAAVDISPAQLSVVQGDQEALSATPRTSGGQTLSGRSVEWSTDDPSVASVNSMGQVEGIAPSTTRIHATVDQVTGSALITVLPGRTIVLSAGTLQLEGITGEPDPVEQELAVTNGGGGTLDGLVVTVHPVEGGPTDWLQPTLATGTAPTTLQVRAHPEELEPGSYQARLTLSAPRALNTPVSVDVTFDVREPDPVLDVTPGSLSLSARAGAHEPATQTVSILNAGGGVLGGLTTSIRYEGSGSVEWLSADLDAVLAPTEMTLSGSARHLSPGVYSAVVRVSSSVALNGFAEVVVTFTVGGETLSPGSPVHSVKAVR
jgi:hypothetical protein